MEQHKISLITNLFCIIGKPGSGKQYIMSNIFSDKDFVRDNELLKFIYGTTKEVGASEMNGVNYKFYTMKDFKNIDPQEIVEQRSYENFITQRVDYYFTLKSDIKIGKNYIGKVSMFQFEELRKWAQIEQLSNPNTMVNVYPIYITCPLKERLNSMLKEAVDDQDVYQVCARLLSERYEYSTLMENKVIDKYDPNTCIVGNRYFMDMRIDEDQFSIEKVKNFIKDRIQTNIE